jgi:hypothetical protein
LCIKWHAHTRGAPPYSQEYKYRPPLQSSDKTSHLKVDVHVYSNWHVEINIASTNLKLYFGQHSNSNFFLRSTDWDSGEERTYALKVVTANNGLVA